MYLCIYLSPCPAAAQFQPRLLFGDSESVSYRCTFSRVSCDAFRFTFASCLCSVSRPPSCGLQIHKSMRRHGLGTPTVVADGDRKTMPCRVLKPAKKNLNVNIASISKLVCGLHVIFRCTLPTCNPCLARATPYTPTPTRKGTSTPKTLYTHPSTRSGPHPQTRAKSPATAAPKSSRNDITRPLDCGGGAAPRPPPLPKHSCHGADSPPPHSPPQHPARLPKPALCRIRAIPALTQQPYGRQAPTISSDGQS